MADEITNQMLLEHIQGMKYDLEQKIDALDKRIGSMGSRIGSLEKRMEIGFSNVRAQLEEARQHREALQEDLEATILKQHEHRQKLAVLSK